MGEPWSLLEQALRWAPDDPVLDVGVLLRVWRPAGFSSWETAFAQVRADKPDRLSEIAKAFAMGQDIDPVPPRGDGMVASGFDTLAAALIAHRDTVPVQFVWVFAG